MMKITDALVAEHKVFCGLFDEIARVLPGVATVNEVANLASLVQGLLERHAAAEAKLALLVLDHVLAENGQLDRMHHDHEEIDVRLREIARASTVTQARQLLSAAIAYSRSHFKTEERSIFPFLERTVRPETLSELGTAWLEQPRTCVVGK